MPFVVRSAMPLFSIHCKLLNRDCFWRMTGVFSFHPKKEGTSMATQPTAQPAPARTDPVRVDPKHYTVEIENEIVRVLRIKYGPREKSEMHGHPALVAIMITDCHARFTYPDG